MQDPIALIDLLHLFFSDAASEEAITLCRREQVSEYIVDARFILATPAALRLYGRSIEEMRTWHSLTQPLEEARRSRAIAAARHFDPGVPSRYRTELLTPRGEVVLVVKDAKELMVDGSTHWLTRLSPAAAAPELPSTQAIALPVPSAEHTAFAGHFSIADIHLFVEGDQEKSQFELRDRLRQPMIDNKRLLHKGEQLLLRTDHGMELVFGKPLVEMPSGQYLFECQSCGWVWLPSKREGKTWAEVESEDIMVPERCGNPERRCYNWRTGSARKPGPKPKRERTGRRQKKLNPLQ